MQELFNTLFFETEQKGIIQMEKFKFAIIGCGGRGRGNQFCVMSMPDVEVVALCDLYLDKAELCADDNEKVYGRRPVITSDYKEILAMPNVDAVMICTSWESHVPIAIDAMRAGKATALEVGGAYSVNDCFDLVRTYEETKTPFMMLENCCFDKKELLVTSMARNGLYGEIVHCSGSYSHDLRTEVLYGKENRHYRLRNYIHRNCDNYPTHDLGPIAKLLDINRGNRMVSLVSMASKSAGLKDYVNKHKDKVDPDLIGQEFAQGDIVTTLIKCANGATIQLRLDTSLPRVYDRDLMVHGTNGYTRDYIIALDNPNGEERYSQLRDFESKYLPTCWTDMTEEGKRLGHGGMDGIEFRAFIDCVRNGEEMPIDVYDAAAWMCISCLSETSIAQGGMPQEIPDFTHGEWLIRPRKDVVEFPVVEAEEK